MNRARNPRRWSQRASRIPPRSRPGSKCSDPIPRFWPTSPSITSVSASASVCGSDVNRGAFLAACALAVLLAGCSRAPKPNVVLIVLDTLRGDRLSCMGYGRPTTPRIDALAAQGALYTRAFATCFWTLPSHASLMTGLHPLQAGATSETLHFPDENVTLAEALGAAGYRTAGFVCNSWVSRERGFSQGFTEFLEMWRSENQTSADSTITSMEMLTVDRMEAWIASAAKGDKPFFPFANLNGVHLPYRPAQEYLSQFVANRGHDIERVRELAQITSGWSHLVGETVL